MMWSGAHALARLEEYAFDYVFYPYMLYSGGETLLRLVWAEGASADAGYWTGFGVLSLLSLVLNLLYIRLYDWSGRDWFAFEYLRNISVPQRITAVPLLAPTARVVTFAYLSIWHSPLFATLWMRSRERQFSMSRRDWMLFGTAVLVANLGWTAAVTAAVTIIRVTLDSLSV